MTSPRMTMERILATRRESILPGQVDRAAGEAAGHWTDVLLSMWTLAGVHVEIAEYSNIGKGNAKNMALFSSSHK